MNFTEFHAGSALEEYPGTPENEFHGISRGIGPIFFLRGQVRAISRGLGAMQNVSEPPKMKFTEFHAGSAL